MTNKTQTTSKTKTTQTTGQESKKQDFHQVFAEGIAMYASVHTPKKGFNPSDSPQYSIDLVVDDVTAKRLLDEGLRLAKTMVDEDTKKPKEYAEYPGKKVFSFRKNTLKKDGTPSIKPEVVDAQNNPIPSNILIGNGSRVLVSLSTYIVPTTGKTGHNLLGVQVLDLVPYEKQGVNTGFKKTEGFTIESQAGFESQTDGEDEIPF